MNINVNLDTATIAEALIILGSSIKTEQEATLVIESLLKMDGTKDVSIDLEDRENVIRLECHYPMKHSEIVNHIKKMGFICYTLLDK